MTRALIQNSAKKDQARKYERSLSRDPLSQTHSVIQMPRPLLQPPPPHLINQDLNILHPTETGQLIQRVTALTLEDEEEVVALLKEIIKNERQLEAIKIDLVRNSDFNL